MELVQLINEEKEYYLEQLHQAELEEDFGRVQELMERYDALQTKRLQLRTGEGVDVDEASLCGSITQTGLEGTSNNLLTFESGYEGTQTVPPT